MSVEMGRHRWIERRQSARVPGVKRYKVTICRRDAAAQYPSSFDSWGYSIRDVTDRCKHLLRPGETLTIEECIA